MLRPLLICITCIISLILPAQQTVQMKVTSLPAYHPSGSAIYLAGSFNGWNPRDENYRFAKSADGLYILTTRLPDGSHEYKLTRGSWSTAECSKAGAPIQNRILQVMTDEKIELKIEEWADRFPTTPKTHTASKQVCTLDSNFLMPELGRTRRVSIYLPAQYCEDLDKRFPVLYLQDGQNMFDEATSFSGEWGVDEFLDSTTLDKCIVVAVDHGNEKRLNEYNPYDHPKFGKGEGAQYAKFLAKTLKPFIDNNFRTLKGNSDTYIAGSSMGGLISLYTALRYPKVFGAAGIFSPALWVAGEGIYEDIRKYGSKVNSAFYFYGGKLEGEKMVPDILRVYEELSKVSSSRMTTVIRDEGRHTESTWQQEFPLFYQWVTKGDIIVDK